MLKHIFQNSFDMFCLSKWLFYFIYSLLQYQFHAGSHIRIMSMSVLENLKQRSGDLERVFLSHPVVSAILMRHRCTADAV